MTATVTEFLRPQHWRETASGPRYVQLRRRLEEAITKGLVAPDLPLPSEREIAAVTELSRVTVRRAIQDLVENGTIIQRQGSGSFLNQPVPRVEQSLSTLTSFSEDMARRGLETRSIWLESGVVLPSPQEVVALALPAGALVTRIARLREAGGQPMAIERAALPRDILPDPQTVGASLYQTLAARGHRPTRAVQKISAINLQIADAQILNVPAGTAGLRIERTTYLAQGRAVEFTQSIYRGDAYDFVAELRLPREAP
ncbi:GntR family transcriptional regulator [Actibacterium sp. 188UL27-1]|uniref:GntR family transcriptional regulator n=1 Tax=Actibacterium sp. 188UL27-1 TaxID=2786961 RepID=UPI00195EC228|nr:GntR family transcriptional regulator [Actibacterium sp. 188UL27-1]MBM7066617.1 GntR family transcriptional regulator [Actibacterium sp. 188UL27-1]